MKRRNYHSTSSSAPSKSRRGRPPKEEQQRLSELDRESVAQEFRLRPLRHPVDVPFAPYYARILNGDLSVISDYVERNAARKELDSSFYEFLGRLVTIRFYRTADLVLSDIERRGNIGFPTTGEADTWWSKRLLPLAESAKEWIREYLKSSPEDWNRERAWYKYAETTCKDDWERAEESSANGKPGPAYVCGIKRHRVIYYACEKPLWREDYMILGLVPRELFWLLAENRAGAKRPSWAVREYLRKYRDRLNSQLKSVRKKID